MTVVPIIMIIMDKRPDVRSKWGSLALRLAPMMSNFYSKLRPLVLLTTVVLAACYGGSANGDLTSFLRGDREPRNADELGPAPADPDPGRPDPQSQIPAAKCHVTDVAAHGDMLTCSAREVDEEGEVVADDDVGSALVTTQPEECGLPCSIAGAFSSAASSVSSAAYSVTSVAIGAKDMLSAKASKVVTGSADMFRRVLREEMHRLFDFTSDSVQALFSKGII